jgi:hypothetical protein
MRSFAEFILAVRSKLTEFGGPDMIEETVGEDTAIWRFAGGQVEIRLADYERVSIVVRGDRPDAPNCFERTDDAGVDGAAKFIAHHAAFFVD